MNQPEVVLEKVCEYSEDLASGLGLLMPVLSERMSTDPIDENRLIQIIESSDRDQFIARLHGRIVGAATMNLVIGLNSRKGWLEDFVVSNDEEVRGKGIGYALWQELIIWCSERDANMEFTSHPSRTDAHKFYIRQGAIIRPTSVFQLKPENSSD